MGFVKRMNRNVAKHRIDIRMMVVPFIWLVDVLQGTSALYCINYDKRDESPPFLAFRKDFVNAIFLEY